MPKDHYDVLNITELRNTPLKSDRIKIAYRQALLSHHPDKSTTNGGSDIPTVDEITLAYQVLSDPKTRAEYDRELSQKAESTSRNGTVAYRTPGLEVIDLDDMIYNEQTNTWTRECRCGTGGGFLVSEENLEKALNNTQPGETHAIMVGCDGCSLALKVEFAAAEE